jgi:micrococcal nuclease
MKEHFITGLVIAGITGFFIYQSHQKEISKRPAYEGNAAAIARPINLADTQFRICQTTKVSDGDTINVDCDGEVLKIRFCGIDAPEKKQPLGQESKAMLSKLVEGKQVVIRPMEKDRYDRTVAEVTVKVGNDDIAQNVNAEMVKAGMAYHYAQYSKNCPSRNLIVEAEAIAQKNKIGVWSGDYQKPWEYRRASK